LQILSQLRRHAAAAWRHRWKALALAWLICGVGWAAVYAIPNGYRASARVYADADAVLATLLRGIAVENSPGQQVELLQRTLLSRPNLAQVVARTDLDMRVNSVSSREALLDRLGKEIRLQPQTRNLFTVDYTDPDPRVARDVVQSVLNLFTEAVAGTDRQQMENAQSFLLQQIGAYEVRLREAERRRAEFQARYIDLLPSDANGGVSRLEGARSHVNRLRGQLEDARTRVNLTRQQLDAAPAMIVAGTEGGGPGGNALAAEAERTLRELRLRYTEEHPDVISARAALAAARSSGGTSAAPARNVMRPNPLHEQLRIRMVDAETEVASLERQIRDGDEEVERLDNVARGVPEVQAQFTNLDRDYNVLRRNYEELLARRESIRIADAARTGSDRVKLEVVDPPTVPTIPVTPNRPLFYAAVLVAGLGAGAALALLLSQMDAGFYTVHDLRRLDLPVLGRISAPPRPVRPRIVAGAGFSLACALLLLAFGAMIAGPTLMANAPSLLMRPFA
jgi:polysaccharide chain length determinant protein (PEP-CTERM system associated)